MSAVDSRLHVHLVWATKNRLPALDPRRAQRVHGLLDRLCRDRHCLALAIGGVEDHVHLLVGLRPALAVSDLVRELKVATSPFIARQLGVDGFAWQRGYGAFAVYAADVEIVGRYILNQPTHHADATTLPEWELPTLPATSAQRSLRDTSLETAEEQAVPWRIKPAEGAPAARSRTGLRPCSR